MGKGNLTPASKSPSPFPPTTARGIFGEIVARGCFLAFRVAARESRAVAAAAAATGGPEEDGGLNFSVIRRTCISSDRSLDSGSLYPFALMAAG